MALITQAELEQHLQITFGNDPDPVVATYIAQAEAAAAGYCQVSSLEEVAATTDVVETFEVDQWDPWYRLSGIPVTAVASVVVDNETLVEGTDYRWYSDGRVRRFLNGDDRSWSRLISGNVITFTHGYTDATAPEDLKLGLLIIAGELFRHGAQFAATGISGVVQSVALDGSDQITYQNQQTSPVPSAGSVFIPAASKQLLGKYRRRKL